MSRNKKDYEEAINTVLETDIEWSKLKKDDLVKFAQMLNEPEQLMEKLGVEADSDAKPFERAIDIGEKLGKKWVKHSNGPIAKRLREQFGEG